MKSAAKLVLLLPTAAMLLVAAKPAERRKVTSPAPVTALPDTVRVAITTEQGVITLDLDGKHAPITTRNFLRYADQRRFDGIKFYRVMRLSWGNQPNGLIQAGTQGDPKRELPPIAHEPTSQTGVVHKAGAISMARFAPGTAKGDFTIMLSDMPGLDADPSSTNPELQAGFAAFGYVVEGMDVARKIFDLPTSPTAGQGIMRGQLLARPVKILTVRRTPVPTPSPAKAAASAQNP